MMILMMINCKYLIWAILLFVEKWSNLNTSILWPHTWGFFLFMLQFEMNPKIRRHICLYFWTILVTCLFHIILLFYKYEQITAVLNMTRGCFCWTHFHPTSVIKKLLLESFQSFQEVQTPTCLLLRCVG